MTRVQLELSDREMQRLEHIMTVCDLGSRKELFGNAFTALEWMVGETRAGRRVFSMQDNGGDKYVLNLPALQNVTVMSNEGLADTFESAETSETSSTAIEAGQREATDHFADPLLPKAASG